MGQCCGGVVEILFEPIAGDRLAGMASRPPSAARPARACRCSRDAHIESAPIKFVVTAHNRVFGADRSPTTSLDPGLVTEARSILSGDRQPHRKVQDFFEPIVAPDLNIAVFGAGHVGTAVVDTLSSLDCNIRWIDSRREYFPADPRQRARD